MAALRKLWSMAQCLEMDDEGRSSGIGAETGVI